MHPRRQRFARADSIPAMEITDRDREVLRFVLQHRFLNSRQIIALLGVGGQTLMRRLHLLYHHGYLERPRCQLDYFYIGGSRPMVYGLTTKGASVLRQHGIAVKTDRLSDMNRSVGREHLEHTLFVADVMIAIELACRNAGVRFITSQELIGDTSLRWRVKFNDKMEIGLMPDSAFALERKNEAVGVERAYFLLEADRGTMPIARKQFFQSSVYRKLLVYQATWQQNLHESLFGFHRFRVLVITKTAKRMNGIIDSCSELEHGLGLFLFADRSILEKPEGILSVRWHTAKGETSTILD